MSIGQFLRLPLLTSLERRVLGLTAVATAAFVLLFFAADTALRLAERQAAVRLARGEAAEGRPLVGPARKGGAAVVIDLEPAGSPGPRTGGHP